MLRVTNFLRTRQRFRGRWEKCEDKTNKLNTIRPNLIKARENTSHTQHKLESIRKRLEAAEKIHSQKQNIIQELQSQLDDLEKRKKVFEAQIAEETVEKNIELEQSQMAEYSRLKEQVATKSAEMLNEIHRFFLKFTRSIDSFQTDCIIKSL